MKLTLNQLAPNFSLPDQNGKLHHLSDYQGRYVLLYFYPKDNTPGCILEACNLRDNSVDFSKYDTVILGISADSTVSHNKFASKFQLPFPILADIEKKVLEAYGVWGEKKFMGKTYMGINRISFLINPEGKIVKIYDKVKPLTHAKEVLADIKTLAS